MADLISWTYIRRRILERDNNTCQHCGAVDRLEVHHIIKRADGGSNDDDNLVTLCVPCHRRVEKRGGWRNPASAANGKAGGRRITSATIRTGDGLLLSQVYPDGGYADLGRGAVTVTGRGNSRIITIPQPDGSEIRILLPK